MKKKLLNNNVRTTVAGLVADQKARLEKAHMDLLRQAEQMGEQDGSLNLPEAEDPQLSPNELLIRSEYQKLIADSWNEGRPYLDKPHLDYQSTVEEIQSFEQLEEKILAREMETLQREKNEKMAYVDKEYQIRQDEIEQFDKVVQRDYLVSRQALQLIQDRVGRSSPLIHFRSTFWYLVLLAGLGFAEVPLNIQIFQKFGEAFFITIIMACSLGIAIPVLAHFTGVFVKQRSEKREYGWFALLAITLFFIFNFGVSIFRAYVLAEHTGETANNLNIIIFVSLNLILFVIGVLAAYFRHDESYELEHTYEKFQKEKKYYDKEKLLIQRRLKEIAEDRNNKLQEIQHHFNQRKVMVNNRKFELVTRRNKAAQVYDELLNSFTALEAMIEASYAISISKYRAANLMHRENRRSPDAWQKGQQSLELKYSGCSELDPN
ncbi:MAG: hypothetical protein AAFV95_11265 [Bacteroidota bacterium]